MEYFEKISGARMHSSFYKPVLDTKVLNMGLGEDILDFVNNCLVTLNEVHNLLTVNKIWKIRLKNIGILDYKNAMSYNTTGIIARSAGVKKDIRLNKYTTYNNYFYLNFNSFITDHGDSYDRFLLRMYEISESLNIINQNLSFFFNTNNNNLKLFNFFDEKNSMELIIKHFKFWSDGISITKNCIYVPVESPKGEFGVSVISDNSNKPFRCKIKSPSINHLNLLKTLSKDTFLSDLVTLIGTIDIVFGEIDR